MSSRAAVAEARRVIKPPETERSLTLSIGLAKASKDDRRTIFPMNKGCQLLYNFSIRIGMLILYVLQTNLMVMVMCHAQCFEDEHTCTWYIGMGNVI